MKLRVQIKDRLFRRWFLFSLLIVCVFLLTGSGLYSYAAHTIEWNIRDSKQSKTEKTAMLLEDYLNGILKGASALLSNERIHTASHYGSPASGEDFYNMHRVGEELKGFYQYSNVEDVYLWYERSGCFMNSYQLFWGNEAENFLENYFGLSLSEWRSFTQQIHGESFYRKFRESSYLFFPMKRDGIGKISSVLIVRLSAAELENFISGKGGSEETNYILTAENALISSYPTLTEAPVSYDEAADGARLLDRDLITCTGIENTDWKLVSIFPESVYNRETFFLKITLTAYLVVGLLLGVSLVYVDVRSKYRPLREIKQNLKALPAADMTGSDTISFVKNRIRQLMEDNLQMAVDLQKQEEQKRPAFLKKLLLENGGDGRVLPSLEEREKYLPLFSSGLAVRIEILQRGVWEDLSSPKVADTFLFALNNVLEELLGENIRLSLIFDSDIVGVIWCGEGKTISEHRTAQVLRQTCELLREYYGMRAVYYLGRAVQKIDGLPQAAREAALAQEYCRLLGECRSAIYEEYMGAEQDVCGDSLLVTAKKDFLAAMLDHEYVRAQKEWEKLIAVQDPGLGHSVYYLRYLRFVLTNLLFDAVSSEEREDVRAYYQEKNLAAEITRISSFCELNEFVSRQLQLLEENFGVYTLDRKDKMDEVDRYIENHYMQADLGLQQISDRFHISQAYLSREYKREKRNGVTWKINSCRVECAKTLLRQEEKITLQQVAEKSGWTSVQTMMRVFKTMEGQTPGEYRKMARKFQ